MPAKDIPTSQAQSKDTAAGEFSIQRLYVKDFSIETPLSPQIFLEKWEPTVNMDLNTDASLTLENGLREVVLGVTITVKMKEKVAFVAKVKQAGIFILKGFSDEQLERLLGSFCPNILYPYAREAISDAIMRAGFPQLYIAPVNFDAVYEQSKKKAAEQASPSKKP